MSFELDLVQELDMVQLDKLAMKQNHPRCSAFQHSAEFDHRRSAGPLKPFGTALGGCCVPDGRHKRLSHLKQPDRRSAEPARCVQQRCRRVGSSSNWSALSSVTEQ